MVVVCIIQDLSRKQMTHSGDSSMMGLLRKMQVGCGESLRDDEISSGWEQGKLLAPLGQKGEGEGSVTRPLWQL